MSICFVGFVLICLSFYGGSSNISDQSVSTDLCQILCLHLLHPTVQINEGTLPLSFLKKSILSAAAAYISAELTRLK